MRGPRTGPGGRGRRWWVRGGRGGEGAGGGGGWGGRGRGWRGRGGRRRGAGAALVPAGREREFARAVGGELPVGGTTVNAPVTVTTYAADPETVAYRTAARISRLAGI